MAKLSAHGVELLRRELSNGRLAYMSDGKILRDSGDGWKLYAHVKPGVDPAAHAESRRKRHENPPPERAAREHFRQLMVQEFPGLEGRIKVHTLISMMPDDADGVYTTLADENFDVDLDGICELCRAYLAAVRENDEARKGLVVAS